MRFRPRFPIYTLNLKRIPWMWLGIVLLLALLFYGVLSMGEFMKGGEPLDDVQQSVAKSLNAVSYRYNALAKRTLDGEAFIISDISGERNAQGIHLKGRIPLIQGDIEVYQFPDALYRQNTPSGQWLVVPKGGRTSIEQLIAETNPLGAFYFNHVIDVRYAGREKIGKYSCRIYEVMTKGQNKFMALYWEDFNYRLWVDQKEGYIRKAEIMAEHRDNSQHLLSLSITLNDYNESFDIKRPDV